MNVVHMLLGAYPEGLRSGQETGNYCSGKANGKDGPSNGNWDYPGDLGVTV